MGQAQAGGAICDSSDYGSLDGSYQPKDTSLWEKSLFSSLSIAKQCTDYCKPLLNVKKRLQLHKDDLLSFSVEFGEQVDLEQHATLFYQLSSIPTTALGLTP